MKSQHCSFLPLNYITELIFPGEKNYQTKRWDIFMTPGCLPKVLQIYMAKSNKKLLY